MLNFDSLPKNRSEVGFENSLLEDGIYLAKTKNPTMKDSKSSNNQYLVVELHIQKPNGTNTVIFDNFFISDKPLVQYKLAQFLRATNCIIQGNFALKDLTKIVGDKTINVAVKTEKNEGYAARNVVDVFDEDIYSAVTAAAPKKATEPIDEECPFTVGDEEY